MKCITEPLPEGNGLHYGNARAPLVRVVRDASYPNMWRMLWPDGRASDMANLTRVKDAALAICERGPPVRDRRRFNWKYDRSKRPSEAPYIRQSDQALSGVAA